MSCGKDERIPLVPKRPVSLEVVAAMQYEEILADMERAMREGNGDDVREIVPQLNALSERLERQPGLEKHLEKGRFNNAARERLRKEYISRYVLLRGGGPTYSGGEPTFQSEVSGILKDGKEMEEEEQSWIGRLLPCRIVAPISFPFLEKNRVQVLHTAHLLCSLGIFLTVLAYIGAFSEGDTLSYLPWIIVHGPKGDSNAGVRSVCWDLPGKDGGDTYWECKTWSEFDCKSPVADESSCKVCKHQSMHITLAVIMSVFSYIGYSKTTNQRLSGEDSNFVKFNACFAALIGGTNNLIAMLTYWRSCIASVATAPDTSVSPGLGLICILIATLLKVFMGFLHLGLPVASSKNSKISESRQEIHQGGVYTAEGRSQQMKHEIASSPRGPRPWGCC